MGLARLSVRSYVICGLLNLEKRSNMNVPWLRHTSDEVKFCIDLAYVDAEFYTVVDLNPPAD